MKLQVLFASALLAASSAVALGNTLTIQGAPTRYIVYPKSGFFDSDDIAKFFDDDDDITPVYRLPSIGGRAINIKGSSVLDRIAGHPSISHIEKDVIRTSVGVSAEDQVASLRGLLNRKLAETPTYGLQLIGADVTPLNAGTTKQDLLVCIIDSGVSKDHPGLAGVPISGEPGFSPDSCGHGTHVAGTVAGKGGFGVAPGISVYSVKVFDGSSCGWSFSSDLIAATDLCKKAAGNAKLIISMSLGGPESSTAEQDGFQKLNDNGVLSIAAAGNDGTTGLSYPASYPSLISVAAVDSGKKVASFSQKNEQVDIAAPGVNVYSTYLNNGFSKLSGTSMATPHVSGAAAVVWSYGLKQGWTNKEVRNALESTAEDLGTPGRDNSYGFGLVNVCAAAKKAGFDPSNSVKCPGGSSTGPTPAPTTGKPSPTTAKPSPTTATPPSPTTGKPTTAKPTTSKPTTPPTCNYPAWICCYFFDQCE